jgi:hypothetical protein
MHKAGRLIGALLLACILLVVWIWRGLKVVAQNPARKTTIVVSYTDYEWWLISWETNEIQCRLSIDHEGYPTPSEVIQFCSAEVYEYWRNTPPCDPSLDKKRGIAGCEGVYLFLLATQPKTKDVLVELPSPKVWANLDGCTPTPPENRCMELPSLLLTGEEPLPNERIVAIHGMYDGNPFNCDGAFCSIPLHPTNIEGSTIHFWADSSYGDSSEEFTARVRVIDTGVSDTPDSGGWFVDVISSQWQGAPIATCARIWEAFPPAGGPPTWLRTPEQPELLASGSPYYYLAGRLISQGVVSTTECVTGGLLPNGYADACGLEKARPIVEEWQNQFDGRIIQVARETGVPAQLMKNLFAQESQFWPGVFRVPYEFGLGQITDNGADTILLWNASFFDQFCPLVLAQDACAQGYLHLKPEDTAILRGALALQAKADCQDCNDGIDLSNVNFSVSLFANTLQANCEQVDQTILTATKSVPGTIASYEDLWRFTVANYHAGPGCVSYAIHQAWQSVGILNWKQVSARFTDPCKGVVPYVEKIAH